MEEKKEKASEVTEAINQKKRRINCRDVGDVKAELQSEFSQAFLKYLEQYEKPEWGISGKIGSSSTYSLRLNKKKKSRLYIKVEFETINCD